VFEESDARGTGRWRGEAGLLATPPDGHFPKQNVGPVKFEVPKVPVIFVLGLYQSFCFFYAFIIGDTVIYIA